ncbi:hypothetical protein LNP74_28970 [Klebsiella pneumoniae subsp. pneumoniae]|nr:hypothetical protein [Klebsiella pneumoniae subsp. pneumoniae]
MWQSNQYSLRDWYAWKTLKSNKLENRAARWRDPSAWHLRSAGKITSREMRDERELLLYLHPAESDQAGAAVAK